MNINLLTVCTDVYPTEYARKLITRFKDITELNVTAYCITDRPEEVKDFATPLERPFKVKGWWNKMFCYSKKLIPCGWNVYLDLDMVLCENFDKEILYAIKKAKKVASFSDAIKWCNNDYNSSFLVFKTGAMDDVYGLWESSQREGDLTYYEGGDQVWTGQLLEKSGQGKNVLYLDKKFPLTKQSLKFQLGVLQGDQLRLPLVKPSEVKIIDCNGNPKPDQLEAFDYIKKCWHNI